MGKGLQLRLDDERIKSRLIVKNWQAFKMVSGTKVLLKVLRYGDPMELEIVQLLGHIDDPGVDILSVLLEYDIDPQFPEEVMEQAQRTPSRVSPKEKEGRRDCTGKMIITIDGEDSKDLDDAVALRRLPAVIGWAFISRMFPTMFRRTVRLIRKRSNVARPPMSSTV